MEGGTETPDRDVYLELRVSGILRTCKTHSRVSRVIQHLPVLSAFEINSHVKEEQSAQEEIQELRGGSRSEREEVIDGLQAAQIAG